jgi:hypothetical protein
LAHAGLVVELCSGAVAESCDVAAAKECVLAVLGSILIMLVLLPAGSVMLDTCAVQFSF